MKYEIRKTELSECLVGIEDDGKEWFIPTNPANSDYQAYLESLNETKTV